MSSGRRLPLVEAERLALAVVKALAPACERIEIAGSIRRKKPDVGDIEIVAVPRLVDGPCRDLFSAPPKVSALDAAVEELRRAGRLTHHPERPANGEKYKRLWIVKAQVQLDLFIVRPPAEWGPIFAIRTGSSHYSSRAVTALRDRGLRCEDGAIWRGDERIPCPAEADFFALAGMPWLPPERRA